MNGKIKKSALWYRAEIRCLDILLNGKLSQAISAGVRVETLRCRAPEQLSLSDAELCPVVFADGQAPSRPGRPLYHEFPKVQGRLGRWMGAFSCGGTGF